MNTTRKHVIGVVMFVILVFQIIAINKAAYVYKEFKSNQQYQELSNISLSDKYVSETIRWQQRNMLNSLKQSWVKYIENNNNESLIKKNEEGYPIYVQGNSSIGFNSDTMLKESIPGSYYFNIINRSTNEIIFTDARPQWDSEKVEEILDMLVAPLKVFGNNGGIIVYDSNTGEVFLDTTPVNRSNNKYTTSIFDDVLLDSNKNKEETETIAKRFFSLKKDSNSLSNIVYMYNEPTKMGDDSSNFEKFPLGKYNRQFVEMAILPYETIGFDGQPMQLTILSIADEQDICSNYTAISNQESRLRAYNENLYGKVSAMLILSILGTMITMLIVLYIIKQCGDEDRER